MEFKDLDRKFDTIGSFNRRNMVSKRGNRCARAVQLFYNAENLQVVNLSPFSCKPDAEDTITNSFQLALEKRAKIFFLSFIN